MVERNYSKTIKKTSFTLIETLITISVIALLAGAGIVIFSRYRARTNLTFALQQLADDLKKTRSMGIMTIDNAGNIPEGGYGIFLSLSNGCPPRDSDSYILFADNDGDRKYDDPVEMIEKIKVPYGVEIKELKKGDGTPLQCLQVIFVPPEPTIIVKGKTTTISVGEVVFRVKGLPCPEYCKSLKVYDSGKIEY